MLQENQTPSDFYALDAPALSNTADTVDDNEESSASVSLLSPYTASSISSVQVQSTADSAAKIIHEETERTDREQKACKRQKTKTTPPETNTTLMNEAEVRMAVEEFGRYFENSAKLWIRLPPDMMNFANNLAQRGLTSTRSREIVELCTASEKWLGHDVFWRMLLFFMDTVSLHLTDLNRLEDKKTVVLRVGKIHGKPLSECTREHICYAIAKFRGAERMEIQCSLGILEGRGTANVLSVLRWLLHHVKIECVGITCDLTEAGMTSKVLGRQMATLSKERRGTSVRIDSLALHFNLAQYKDAAVVVKECLRIPVLKIHFIAADPWETGVINQALKALLLHCSVLEQLSVFGVRVGISHIRTIVAMLPQLVLLEVGVLTLEKLVLGLRKEKESMPALLGLKTLKISELYSYYSGADIEKFVEIFPSLKDVQISASDVASPVIDAFSKLPHLRSLEIVNGSLQIETAEYLLEKLPSLECLSVGVKDLDSKLAHALSKCTGMHTLNLRGNYIPGFLASLLQPSPLMSTLEVLSVWRYTNKGKIKFSPKDKHSKDTAMENFGCAVQVIY
ncbi:hypothetical protein NECID01_1957 [Nematocida sp. AWRm77]|nr:hypothetical protein NECID01_1957 [Nematocida sp. AWRm77]